MNKINLKKIIILMIYIAPTIHLAFGMRFGDFFNLMVLLCLIYIYKYGIEDNVGNKKLFIYFSSIYFIYPLEILISQTIRWKFNIHEYMDQIRFIFVYPFFLFLINKDIDLVKFIERAIPIALILSFISTKYFYLDNQFGSRFTNNFTDPLAYGQICFSMSILLAATFLYTESKSLILITYKLLGIGIGLLISILSESRTGWFSLPIVFFLLVYINRKKINLIYFFLLALIPMVFIFCTYNYIDIVNLRINEAVNNIMKYPWSGGVAPDTSVGLRITFQRLGIYYILHNPWYGLGNKGFTDLLFSPETKLFADDFAIVSSYEALFHNELMTQTVRYGVLGFIGYFLVLIFPLYLLIKKSNSNNLLVRNNSILASVFITTQIIAGLTDEILNLKFMIIYFMFLLSISYANIIAEKKL